MPLKLQNMLCSRFKSCSATNDNTRRDSRKSSSRSGDTSVNKEYKKAFRTVSYTEIYDKVQGQLVRASDGATSSTRSSRFHFSTNLLEPQQEIINSLIESGNFHPFLVDFFEASLKACHDCEVLLQNVYKTRANYQKIWKAIDIAKRRNTGRKMEELRLLIRKELVEFAMMENPLQAPNAIQFNDIHDHYKTLLQKLASKHKKVKRRMKFERLFKKVVKWGLVVSCTAISVAIIIGAIHSTAGMVTVPVLVTCTLLLLLRGAKSTTQESKRTNAHNRLSAQLDQAAKGIFVLISNLDTMNSLLRRLQDEVDHIKATVNICKGNMNDELLKLVIKELDVHDSNFMERVLELEEHIYLCFLDINRSRRSIMQVTMNFYRENSL